MNNADKPIHPTEVELNGKDGKVIIAESLEGNPFFIGLTKREYFVALAMQGLMYHFKDEGHELSHAENIARKAIRTADELLKQLES